MKQRKRGQTQKQLFIEPRSQGDYAVRRPNSKRASAVEPTQAKAEKRARQLEPDAVILPARGETHVETCFAGALEGHNLGRRPTLAFLQAAILDFLTGRISIASGGV